MQKIIRNTPRRGYLRVLRAINVTLKIYIIDTSTKKRSTFVININHLSPMSAYALRVLADSWFNNKDSALTDDQLDDIFYELMSPENTDLAYFFAEYRPDYNKIGLMSDKDFQVLVEKVQSSDSLEADFALSMMDAFDTAFGHEIQAMKNYLNQMFESGYHRLSFETDVLAIMNELPNAQWLND